jgi:hypothetical protein
MILQSIWISDRSLHEDDVALDSDVRDGYELDGSDQPILSLAHGGAVENDFPSSLNAFQGV